MYLKENLKLLRKRRKRSQEDVSKSLKLTRSAYNSYENGVAEPGIQILIRLSEFFQINIDKLIRIDLNQVGEMQLSQLEKGFDLDLSGTRLRILATTVNSDNEENIELVPVKAKAGYATGYADPDYIKTLPAFNLPFLSANRKYRSFPISGDSMPPVSDGAFVTGEYKIGIWLEMDILISLLHKKMELYLRYFTIEWKRMVHFYYAVQIQDMRPIR